MRRMLIFAVAFSCITLSGCAGNFHIEDRPTQGQELTDLYAAYREGAISLKEYEEAKRRILERE